MTTYLAVSIILDSETPISTNTWASSVNGQRMIACQIAQLSIIFKGKDDLDRLIEQLAVLSDFLAQGIE